MANVIETAIGYTIKALKTSSRACLRYADPRSKRCRRHLLLISLLSCFLLLHLASLLQYSGSLTHEQNTDINWLHPLHSELAENEKPPSNLRIFKRNALNIQQRSTSLIRLLTGTALPQRTSNETAGTLLGSATPPSTPTTLRDEDVRIRLRKLGFGGSIPIARNSTEPTPRVFASVTFDDTARGSSSATNLWKPTKELLDLYAPLNAEDKAILARTFSALLAAVAPTNLSFFLYSGSLLGSYRHHDIIPWDDDVDLMFSDSDKPRLRDILERASPDYGLHVYLERFRWKFYPLSGGHAVNAALYNSPYVDVFFYVENETHLCNEESMFSSDCWPKADIFPLSPRPFLGLMVPAPCNARAVLAANFNLTLCESRSFDHIRNDWITDGVSTRPCRELEHLFPFVVKRAEMRDKVGYDMEALAIGAAIIGEIELRARCPEEGVVTRPRDKDTKWRQTSPDLKRL